MTENGVLPVSRSVVVGLVVFLLLSLSLNGFLYYSLLQSPEVVYVETPGRAAEQQPPATVAEVVVHVSGAVNRPNVYTLAAGSRAISAVEAAGGALADADLEGLNLARVLNDGEQLHIPRRGEQGSAVVTPGPQTPRDSRININTANQTELETLPGIGPTRAAAIIAYRQQHGPFGTPEDLMKVSGVGTKTFEGLKDLIRVR